MSETIETLLDETRHFAPTDEFKRNANLSDPGIYAAAAADLTGFWERQAKELDWFEPWHTALEWNRPFAKWFLGGKLNAAYNCVDRHADSFRADKVAIIWEGEPGEVRKITYRQLREEVSKIANALKELGVVKGDRVCIYLPMVPELAMTMLACARIGAAHSVVFGGFSAESLAERTNDAQAKVLVTADGGYRRGQVVPLLQIAQEALEMDCPSVEKVLVLERLGTELSDPSDSRLVNWSSIVPRQPTDCPCEPMDSEDLLFILYTSGSTGKPKGIIHTTGGYLTQVAATSRWVFDLKEDDVYFCTADCGWVTGHSYLVYGPMAEGATCIMYEGAPDTPDKDRFWRIIERHRATILYTAPTAIRAFMKWGTQFPERCDLSSLRLLGSVGEPINPEAWIWYHEVIGRRNCPIVDTWWQTETGGIMIAPLPGITPTKPGSATVPLPGIIAAVMNDAGQEITPIQGGLAYLAEARGLSAPESGPEVGGILAISHPWPGMTRGIYGDPERFQRTYWDRFPNHYFPGDGTKVDEDGYFWLLGRVDDIMLVAGHNISTMEVESALVDHHCVAEAAVIGKTHELKGQGISAFVILKTGSSVTVDELKRHVTHKIGAIARPDDIFLCADLPKTRSGKIMRRLLRDVAEGRALGDTTTLADPNVVRALMTQYEDSES